MALYHGWPSSNFSAKRKENQKEKRNEQRGLYGIPEDYAEELGPLILLGQRSETGWATQEKNECAHTYAYIL